MAAPEAVLTVRLRCGPTTDGELVTTTAETTVAEFMMQYGRAFIESNGMQNVRLIYNGKILPADSTLAQANVFPDGVLNLWRIGREIPDWERVAMERAATRAASLTADQARWQASAAAMSQEAVLAVLAFEDIVLEHILPRLPFKARLAFSATCRAVDRVVRKHSSMARVGVHLPSQGRWPASVLDDVEGVLPSREWTYPDAAAQEADARVLAELVRTRSIAWLDVEAPPALLTPQVIANLAQYNSHLEALRVGHASWQGLTIGFGTTLCTLLPQLPHLKAFSAMSIEISEPVTAAFPPSLAIFEYSEYRAESHAREGLYSWRGDWYSGSLSTPGIRRPMPALLAAAEAVERERTTIQEPEGSFNVEVKTLVGAAFKVRVHPLLAVGDFKVLVEGRTGIPADAQRYIHQGRGMADEQLMRDHNVNAQSTLHMVLRLRG